MSEFLGSYVHIPPTPHKCPVPHCDDPIGTVWRCGKCGTYWRRADVYVGYGSGPSWTTDLWRNFKARNLRGYFNAIARGSCES